MLCCKMDNRESKAVNLLTLIRIFKIFMQFSTNRLNCTQRTWQNFHYTVGYLIPFWQISSH